MSKVFIIAEAACTWLHGGLEAACRSIQAAKECGADAWKTQWTSDPLEMGKRRGMDGEKYRRLAWPAEWHASLKAKCEEVGIRYLCTVFTPKDVEIIKPFVEFIKVSAFESQSLDMAKAVTWSDLPSIVSVREGCNRFHFGEDTNYLYVVSEYPTPLEHLRLGSMKEFDGLSDHTGHVLTGAVAVGAGARIIEAHVRMSDTPDSDPDFGHSHVLNNSACFPAYVQNIRLAERML